MNLEWSSRAFVWRLTYLALCFFVFRYGVVVRAGLSEMCRLSALAVFVVENRHHFLRRSDAAFDDHSHFKRTRQFFWRRISIHKFHEIWHFMKFMKFMEIGESPVFGRKVAEPLSPKIRLREQILV